MIDELAGAYDTIRDQLDADICPVVGRAFEMANDQDDHLGLYSTDGSHPNVYGTYLAVCLFYACMFKENILEVEYVSSPAISEEDSEIFQTIAWQTYLQYGL